MSEKNLQGPSVHRIPPGDDRERLVCPDCGFIDYQNPRIIVAAVCEWEDQVLLCRRAIEPRLGYWTIPAGFMELGETSAEGAARETWEEAKARVTPVDLLGIFDIPHVGHVYMVYRAPMQTAEHDVGAESSEVRLFDWADIPWDELAFPSIRWALDAYRQVKGKTEISAQIKSYRPSSR